MSATNIQQKVRFLLWRELVSLHGGGIQIGSKEGCVLGGGGVEGDGVHFSLVFFFLTLPTLQVSLALVVLSLIECSSMHNVWSSLSAKEYLPMQQKYPVCWYSQYPCSQH